MTGLASLLFPILEDDEEAIISAGCSARNDEFMIGGSFAFQNVETVKDNVAGIGFVIENEKWLSTARLPWDYGYCTEIATLFRQVLQQVMVLLFRQSNKKNTAMIRKGQRRNDLGELGIGWSGHHQLANFKSGVVPQVVDLEFGATLYELDDDKS